MKRFSLFAICFCVSLFSYAQQLVDVGKGWAGNSINVVVFRKNSLVSDKNLQFIAYYDSSAHLIVGKRKLNEKKWELNKTGYTGNVLDAHNSISIMIDGEGYLHVAWDHHNNQLNYCKSVTPYSVLLGKKISMTGLHENKVSYPEFYRLPAGNLIFLYRDGGSGNGNLVLNRYDIKTKQWEQLHNNLIDGEGKRSAYWQACVDRLGVFHISWVWRESPDVASNHDLCYAQSSDEGKTWTNSKKEKYQVPINVASAEYAFRIPQKMELINQTSMTADENGKPFIAGYWRDSNQTIPQYHIIYRFNQHWRVQNLYFRKTPFSLNGGGTKRIPVSRPQIIVWQKRGKISAALIFRDEERGSKVSLAFNPDINTSKWTVKDLLAMPVGSWEPSYDTELWKQKLKLHLFIQYVEQTDAEGKSNLPAQMVKVMEWKGDAGF